jgi:hypothetical protein
LPRRTEEELLWAAEELLWVVECSPERVWGYSPPIGSAAPGEIRTDIWLSFYSFHSNDTLLPVVVNPVLFASEAISGMIYISSLDKI